MKGRPCTATRQWLTLAAALTAIAPAHAAVPQPYAVSIAATGDAALDKAVEGASTLIALRETAPVGPFGLIARARDDIDRLIKVLGGLGHYAARVAVRIDGRALDDPGLLGALDGRGATPPVAVRVTVDPGPLFHLRRVGIRGEAPPAARAALALAPGAPAIAADVLAAQGRLLAALQADGFALAKVAPPDATLYPAARALDVVFPVQSGPRVDLGPISIDGLERVNESFVRNRLLVHQGDQYSPAAIEKARADLASLGVFASVRARAAERLDAAGQLPLAFDVTERKRRVVEFGAAWSTDLGGSLSASWTHRNLFGNGERLALLAAVSNLGGTASQGLGYNLSAQFTLPDFLSRDQSLDLGLQALRQYLDAYDQTALKASAGVTRRLTDRLSATAALAFTQEQIIQEGVTRYYTLLGLPLGLKYDSTNSLLDPTSGMRLAATVTPTASFGGGQNSDFVISQIAGSTYLDLAAPGRSVLALRGLVGTIGNVGVFDIPPDQRFYAGGSGTVRGYRYLSLGPQFPDNKPTGGVSVAAGSVEFRQRFGQSLGAVAFVDAGQVTPTANPFGNHFNVGIGAGARYYTIIGPIRLDVAVPVNRLPGGDAFELYLGIGQAF